MSDFRAIREQQLAAIVEVATRMAKRMGCTFVLDPEKVRVFLAAPDTGEA